ncbi:MAG TPA: hypothetical protein VHT96_04010 [Clostridia bacterium]|nr:hypothetical protein [Clostridia bacterium]
MDARSGFQRNYFIFVNEDAGYEAGRKPSGHIKLEIRDGRGRLHAAVQNLRPGNGRFDYALYLLCSGSYECTPVYAGNLGLRPGKAELEWIFDPADVGRSGTPIDAFDVFAVITENSGGRENGLACPLAAYRNKRVDWRNTFRTARMVKKPVQAEIKPMPLPETKPEIKPVTKPEIKPMPLHETKPEVKPVTKAEIKPMPLPETKPEVKSVTKPEIKPMPLPETKPEIKPVTKPEIKPMPLPETKPEVKSEIKPDNKPEAKSETKPEAVYEAPPVQTPVTGTEAQQESGMGTGKLGIEKAGTDKAGMGLQQDQPIKKDEQTQDQSQDQTQDQTQDQLQTGLPAQVGDQPQFYQGAPAFTGGQAQFYQGAPGFADGQTQIYQYAAPAQQAAQSYGDAPEQPYGQGFAYQTGQPQSQNPFQMYQEQPLDTYNPYQMFAPQPQMYSPYQPYPQQIQPYEPGQPFGDGQGQKYQEPAQVPEEKGQLPAEQAQEYQKSAGEPEKSGQLPAEQGQEYQEPAGEPEESGQLPTEQGQEYQEPAGESAESGQLSAEQGQEYEDLEREEQSARVEQPEEVQAAQADDGTAVSPDSAQPPVTEPAQDRAASQTEYIYRDGPGSVNTGCLYLNGNICGAILNAEAGNASPCEACRVHGGTPTEQVKPAGDLSRLKAIMDGNFEANDPFHSKRSDYLWWKITNPVNLNNILYQNNIRSPLMFNPAVMLAHYKYRHLIVGIFTRRDGKKFVVCGVPGMHMVDRKPFGELSKWVQADGSKQRYGAFGYWLVYINPDDGKILNLNQE